MNAHRDITYTQLGENAVFQGKTIESMYSDSEYLLMTFTDGTFLHLTTGSGINCGDPYSYLASDTLSTNEKKLLGLLSNADATELFRLQEEERRQYNLRYKEMEAQKAAKKKAELEAQIKDILTQIDALG